MSEEEPTVEDICSKFSRLLNASENVQQSEPSKSAAPSASVEFDEIPAENLYPPTVHEEPLKTVASPEYVKQVVNNLRHMSTQQLRKALAEIRVSEKGTKAQLKKRVAYYYRREYALLQRRMDMGVPNKTLRFYDFLIAIDFECTCEEVIFDYPHEIIEFPAVLIDVKSMKKISEFRTYVRPQKNPILSDFCIKFTGITQSTVDHAPHFREALELFYDWMKKYGLSERKVRYAFVIDGPHDMWKFMQFQCILSGIKMPHMFRNFVNVKKLFEVKYKRLTKGNGKSGIENMLEFFEKKFEGNKHSGLDDANNIATVAIEMMKRKLELRVNQRCAHPRNGPNNFSSETTEETQIEHKGDNLSDFSVWMKKLPLKLQSVSRNEFITEEYLDCWSCDEMDKDDAPHNSMERKESARAEIQMLFDAYTKVRSTDAGNMKTSSQPVESISDVQQEINERLNRREQWEGAPKNTLRQNISCEENLPSENVPSTESVTTDLINWSTQKTTDELKDLESVWRYKSSKAEPDNTTASSEAVISQVDSSPREEVLIEIDDDTDSLVKSDLSVDQVLS